MSTRMIIASCEPENVCDVPYSRSHVESLVSTRGRKMPYRMAKALATGATPVANRSKIVSPRGKTL
jgi:hypothetical protein